MTEQQHGPLTSVSIQLLDRDYQVRCPSDRQAALLAAADYLNQQLRELRSSGRVQGMEKLAMTAALNMAHEVLAICRGKAKVQLGGENGIILSVSPGDVIIIPAGVAHKNLGASRDFLVVGAYPPGQSWDMNYGEAGERPDADQNISRVPRPKTDPVFGRRGPLIDHWLTQD